MLGCLFIKNFESKGFCFSFLNVYGRGVYRNYSGEGEIWSRR